jgi:hypothetical protein
MNSGSSAFISPACSPASLRHCLVVPDVAALDHGDLAAGALDHQHLLDLAILAPAISIALSVLA